MKRLSVLLGLMLTMAPPLALPDTCYYQPGDNALSGDVFYGQFICDQNYIDQFWYHFSFDRDDWDDGFGYDDPCNIDQPLARTFNALYLLAYSAADYARSTEDLSGNALRWGYPYAASAIDHLDCQCETDARATTISTIWWDDKTILKWPFFYGENVVERAATIVHEARHADGVPHDGDAGCPRGKSCDSRWEYQGANTYQVLYLWWFYLAGTRTTQAMRDYAGLAAQRIIDTGFNEKPVVIVLALEGRGL